MLLHFCHLPAPLLKSVSAIHGGQMARMNPTLSAKNKEATHRVALYFSRGGRVVRRTHRVRQNGRPKNAPAFSAFAPSMAVRSRSARRSRPEGVRARAKIAPAFSAFAPSMAVRRRSACRSAAEVAQHRTKRLDHVYSIRRNRESHRVRHATCVPSLAKRKDQAEPARVEIFRGFAWNRAICSGKRQKRRVEFVVLPMKCAICKE